MTAEREEPDQSRAMIIALFRVIGNQPDLQLSWEKMPNAERNVMAGVFYNIISKYCATVKSSDKVLEPTDKDIAKAALYDCIRPEIRKMAHRMEQKFRLHDEERGNPFREFDDWQVFLEGRLKEERKELAEAIEKGRPPSEVWNEAGDVCNIETMKAVNYERDYWQELRQQQGERERG